MNIIMGASDFAREVYEYHKFLKIEVDGFFDEHAKITQLRKKPVYNSFEEIREIAKKFFVAGTGNPIVNKKFFSLVTEKKLNLAEPIICDSYVGENVNIKNGSIICPKSILSCDIEIGYFSVINASCTIGHDSFLEDFCVISPNCSISGHTTIREATLLGTGVVTVPKVTIQKDSIIGASCLISKSLKESGTFVGIPARKIK